MSAHTILLTGGNTATIEISPTLNRHDCEVLLDALETLLPSTSIEPIPAKRPPVRQFTPAHLRIVYLLAESQGSTHTRLRRAWDAKSARAGALAWPWISDSGLRTRVAELVSWGLVEHGGAWGETPAGRPSRIWQLTGVNPAVAGREALPVPGTAPGTLEALYALRDESPQDLTLRAQLTIAGQVAGILA